MRIQISIKNEFGEYLGEVYEVDESQYDIIKTRSKNFYESGFELVDETGNFFVFPPEVVKKSILKIGIIK